MKHDDWVKWLDQLESSLVRAETAKKDIDILLLLRFAFQVVKEKVKETDDALRK